MGNEESKQLVPFSPEEDEAVAAELVEDGSSELTETEGDEFSTLPTVEDELAKELALVKAGSAFILDEPEEYRSSIRGLRRQRVYAYRKGADGQKTGKPVAMFKAAQVYDHNHRRQGYIWAIFGSEPKFMIPESASRRILFTSPEASLAVLDRIEKGQVGIAFDEKPDGTAGALPDTGLDGPGHANGFVAGPQKEVAADNEVAPKVIVPVVETGDDDDDGDGDDWAQG